MQSVGLERAAAYSSSWWALSNVPNQLGGSTSRFSASKAGLPASGTASSGSRIIAQPEEVGQAS